MTDRSFLAGRPATVALLAGLALWSAACASRLEGTNEVEVVGADHSFTAPDTLPPGPTAFMFRNAGRAPHEMIIVRLQNGVTLDSLIAVVRAGRDPATVTEGGVGIVIANPGATADTRALVNLLPGRTYALICNFRDGPQAPPHLALGMRKAIHVTR